MMKNDILKYSGVSILLLGLLLNSISPAEVIECLCPHISLCSGADPSMPLITFPMMLMCGPTTADVVITKASGISKIQFEISKMENLIGISIHPAQNAPYIFDSTETESSWTYTIQSIDKDFGEEPVILKAYGESEVWDGFCYSYFEFYALKPSRIEVWTPENVAVDIVLRPGGIFPFEDAAEAILAGHIYYSDGITRFQDGKVYLCSIDGVRLDGIQETYGYGDVDYSIWQFISYPAKQYFEVIAYACSPDGTICTAPETILWEIDTRFAARHDFILPIDPPTATPSITATPRPTETPTATPTPAWQVDDCDINKDGVVDWKDLLILQQYWHQKMP